MPQLLPFWLGIALLCVIWIFYLINKQKAASSKAHQDTPFQKASEIGTSTTSASSTYTSSVSQTQPQQRQTGSASTPETSASSSVSSSTSSISPSHSALITPSNHSSLLTSPSAANSVTVPSYFTRTNAIESAGKLYDFILKLNQTHSVIEALDKYSQLDPFKELHGYPDLDQRLASLVFFDLQRCFEGLGHGTNLNCNAGLLVRSFMARLLNPDLLIWCDSEKLNMTVDAFQQFYHTTKRNISITFDPDKLLLLEILRTSEGVDSELADLYALHMYGITYLMAKGYGPINPQEERWLKHLESMVDQSSDRTGSINSSRNRSNNNEAEKDKTGNDNGNPSVSITPNTEGGHSNANELTASAALAELDSLIGLDSVKTEVRNIYNLVKIQNIRQEQGLKSSSISYHCVFTGNPGTGKTTVARLVAQIYKDLGILSKGHLVETDRSGLVAEYVGQTAVKTNKIIDSALEGVLFIDEAYSLVQGSNNDFGIEAISTLLKRMEDDRDRLVVILAGYSSEMKQFIDSNPGLQSRFNRYIHFEDYNAEELEKIYRFNLHKYDYKLTNEATERLREVLQRAVDNKDKNFGNARYVRNLFEKTLENQAKRLASETELSKELLTEIRQEDIPTK